MKNELKKLLKTTLFMSKQCSKCGKVKSLNEFRKQSRNKDWYNNICKDCCKIADKLYYKNKDRKRVNDNAKSLRSSRRMLINDIKKHNTCSCCGNDDARALDLHHIIPSEKTIAISDALSKWYWLEAILDEVKKCCVLCKNCHAIYHSYDYEEDKTEQLEMSNKFKKIILT